MFKMVPNTPLLLFLHYFSVINSSDIFQLRSRNVISILLSIKYNGFLTFSRDIERDGYVAEAVARRCFVKKVLLKISQN